MKKLLYYIIVTVTTVLSSLTLLSIIGVLTMSYIPFGIVLTTSMMPKMPPGTLVFAVPVWDPLHDLHPGDIAIYCVPANFLSVRICKPVVHRVVAVDTRDGIVYFKGDANNVVEPVNPRQVVAKVIFYIPSLYWLEIDKEHHVGIYLPCGVLLLMLLIFAPRLYVVSIREV